MDFMLQWQCYQCYHYELAGYIGVTPESSYLLISISTYGSISSLELYSPT